MKRLFSQTTLSRKLDFDFIVDNLFDELSRLQEVDDTSELRQPYQNLTDKADNRLVRSNEENADEIKHAKTSLRKYYLKLKKDRKDTFLISTDFLFSKLATLTSYEEASQYRELCVREHEEREKLERDQLRIEFIFLSSKPTKDREPDHYNQRQQVVNKLIKMLPSNELNKLN